MQIKTPFKLIVLLFAYNCINSCSQPNEIKPVPIPEPKHQPSANPAATVTKPKEKLADQPVTIKAKLMDQYQEWRGTPYRYGGLSKDGIDCSGFVHVTYKHLFALSLPRTTIKQSYLGQEIDRSDLVEGDLVFFKRGRSFRHVGIYIDDDYFLHASTSRGVVLSKLSDDYWRIHYWMAKRLFD